MKPEEGSEVDTEPREGSLKAVFETLETTSNGK